MSDEAPPKRDVLFVGPPSADGEGHKVLRHRDDSLEVGELRSVKEGKPILGELVKLSPRAEHERLFDVDVVVPKQAVPGQGDGTDGAHKGPARVTSEAYRTSWDRIFGAVAEDDLPN